MNRKSQAERGQIIGCLCEGMSIRATVRLTGASKNTIVKLLAEIGPACAEYQDRHFRNLNLQRVQVDEIWSFCYAKDKHVPDGKKETFGFGDVWVFVALDADTKLVPSWLVGPRFGFAALEFLDDLKSRLAHGARMQLTTDGWQSYPGAVSKAFKGEVDYGRLVKQYGTDLNLTPMQRRYSPPKCIGAERHRVSGDPDVNHVSTSYVERQNLTMRMHMRRFTRLTNAFSKKLENHIHAVNLHYMYYNFGMKQKGLDGQTPAMAAGLADHVWSFAEIAGLIETAESSNMSAYRMVVKDSN